MNASVNSYLLGLNEQSVALMKYQMTAFVLWIVLGTLNGIAGILTIVIIVVWKPLHTDTQELAAHLAFAETMGGLSIAATGCYHVFNILNDIPETTTMKSCYLKVAIQNLSNDSSAFFYLAISLDRFAAAIFPIRYKNRPRNYNTYVSIIFWIIPLMFFISSFYVQRGTLYGPYFGVLYFVGGITSLAVYLICQKEFQVGFSQVIKSLTKLNNNVSFIPSTSSMVLQQNLQTNRVYLQSEKNEAMICNLDKERANVF